METRNLKEQELVNDNLEIIKNQIRTGLTTSSKSFSDTQEIKDLYNENLALKSIEGKAKGRFYELQKQQLNEEIEDLAHRLNQPFIDKTYSTKIVNIIAFETKVEEKLTSDEMRTYQQLLKGKYNYEDLKSMLEKTNFNVFNTLAKLNGFKNILDYQDAKNKEKQEFELQNQKRIDKQERIDEMKQAYKEALQEHNQGI